MVVVIIYVDMFVEKFYIIYWNVFVYVYLYKYDNFKYIVVFDMFKCFYVIIK